MKIVKPSWVNHGGKPIFSIDVHPDGTRFATGGQGENSGKVVIWSMLPVQDEQKESDKNIPKQLCEMDNHLACVNCVRWSSNGRLLASCSDDKLVMIWRYTGGTSHSFGSDQENVETWRCSTTLRGHAGDVLDVAWAPHDVYLATCSVDNMVIVWNALNFPEQVRVLKGHNSLVKGVAWDPIGKYLASQSDDHSLIVWRTRDWRQETVITEPFAECGGTTHVLRPSWSPEGGMLVSAHAMNNAGPVAKIIERTVNWKADTDFVGHRKAVTCVRFNPRVFYKKAIKGSSEKPLHYCCCAIGSRDTSFSVWLTNNGRPLMVMHDMFEKSIMDLAWNAAGTELLVCSTDGTVGYVQFAADELSGRALSDHEKTELLAKFYGKTAVSNGPAAASGGVAGGGKQIIESTAMLKLQQQQQQVATAAAAAAAAASSAQPTAVQAAGVQSQGVTQDAASSTVIAGTNNRNAQSLGFQHPQANLTKQLETRTPDGKRRITPIFLAPPPELSDIPLPVALPMFTTSTEQSKIIVEKTDGATQKSDAADEATRRGLTGATGEAGVAGAAAESDAEEPPKLETAPPSPVFGTSIVSIQPMTISEAASSASIRRTSGTGSNGLRAADDRNEKPKKKVREEPDAECGGGKARLKGAASAGQRMTAKRRLYAAQQQQQQQQKRRRLQQRLADADTSLNPCGASSTGASQQQQHRAEQRGEASAISTAADRSTENREPAAGSLAIFLPPQAQKCLTARAMSGSPAAFTVEAENDMHSSSRGGSGSSSALHCLRCQKQGQTAWEWISSSRIALLAACRWGVALATADQAVTLLNADGRPLCLPIALDGPIAVLQAAGKYCLAATCNGKLWLWDVKVMECVIDAVSMAGLAAIAAELAVAAVASASAAQSPCSCAVESLQLTEDGRIIAKLYDGSAYFYNVRMRSWLRLFTGTDSVRLFSDLQCTTARGGSGSVSAMVPHGVFASLRSHAAGLSRQYGPDAAAAGNIYSMSLAASTESAASMQQACTISHLEEQLAATLALGSASEYKHLLLSLIRYLAQHGLEQRLRVICDELLGPVYKRARVDPVDDENSSKMVLGMNKRELLREALPIIGGANLQLQRLYAEYQEIAELTAMAATAAAPAADATLKL